MRIRCGAWLSVRAKCRNEATLIHVDHRGIAIGPLCTAHAYPWMDTDPICDGYRAYLAERAALEVVRAVLES